MDGGLSPSSSDSEEPSLSNFEPSSRDSDEPSSSGDSDKPSPPKKARPATGTSAAGLSSPNRQRVDINSLINKPDPFEAGLAVPGSGGPCFVMHPSQVDVCVCACVCVFVYVCMHDSPKLVPSTCSFSISNFVFSV